MAMIGLNISASGFTGKLLIRWLEASAPLAEVGRSAAFNFPYDDVYTINDINPVVHIVQLWRSTDGVALSQLIKQWEIDASIFNTITATTYQYQVDRGWTNLSPVNTGTEVWADPANLDTILVDERLDAFIKDQLYVVEAGYGPHLDADYNLHAGGGIELLAGKTFDEGVSWFITAHSTVTQSVPPGTSNSNQYSDVAIITASRDFFVDANDNLYNKLCIINGAGANVTIDFLDMALIPNFTRVTFNTHLGSQNYLSLQFDAGDTIRFCGVDENVIDISKNEEISLFFLNGVVYVTSYSGNAAIRGSIFGDWKNRATTGAFLLADTATGVLAKADYTGLYRFVDSLPPGVAVTTLAAWALDKTKYFIDTITETFRVPHLANMHRRFKATTEVSGTYAADGVGPHTHEAPLAVNSVNPGANVYGRGGDNLSEANISSVGVGIGSETTVKAFKEIPMIIL